MTAEHKRARDVFPLRVFDDPPERACDGERTWTQRWPAMLAETRAWGKLELGNVEACYFGDGSTGTIDDYEHGIYLQMLA